MKTKKELIGIIGLGRFGTALGIELVNNDVDILVCDIDEKKVRNMLTYTDNAFVVEDNSEETLNSIGMQNCTMVVVAIGEDIAKSILTTLTVKNLGVPRVLSKATTQAQGEVLSRLGAEVVYPERDMAIRVAKKLIYKNVMEFLELNNEVEISEVLVPSLFIGKSIVDANIRQRYGLNIIAVDRDGKIITEFDTKFIFNKEDKIVVIGKKEALARFKELV